MTAQGHRFAVDLLHEVALLRFFDKPFPPDKALEQKNSKDLGTGTLKTAEQTTGNPAPQSTSSTGSNATSERRTVTEVTLQGFECGDVCHLRYADVTGQTQTAICMDTKGCQSWAEGPKGFMPLIGAKADLVIGKKFIPEGNVSIDNVVEIKLRDVQ